MPENALRLMFIDEIKGARQKASSARVLDHLGLRGIAREIMLENLLRPVLPPEVKVGTGKLTDVRGHLTRQIDLVLYSPQILPPGLYDQRLGIFPVESALYTVEVKSTLDRQEVRMAVENARSILQMRVLPTNYWVAGKPTGGPTALPVRALFAFDSDLDGEGKSELNRYREIDDRANEEPAIGVICVCGVGYWYFERGDGWKFMRATPTCDEVLSFLGGLTNTIPKLISAKGRPPFGSYLCGPSQFENV